MHSTPSLLHKSPLEHIHVAAAGVYEAKLGADYPPHHHGEKWELVYYREGHIRAPMGDRVYHVHPGMLLLTPPGTLHAELADTSYANYFLVVEAPAHWPWPRCCVDDVHHTLRGVCGALVREWSGDSPERDEMLASLVTQLDIQLRRVQDAQLVNEAERSVREAEHLLRERCFGAIAIADIARDVGVSPSSLRAQFGRLRGLSPQSYVQQLRVQRAMALIRDSSLTMDAIAQLCGYHSASHLSRYVKRATGKSPGMLRGDLRGEAH